MYTVDSESIAEKLVQEGLGEAIDSILSNPFLKEHGRPEADWAFDQFIAAIAGVYERLSGRRAGLSRFALHQVKNGQPGGPTFRFLQACVNSIRDDVTDEGIAYRIAKLREGRRANN